MSNQKRKKNYFHNSGHYQKRHKQLYLEPGMKGFLCTCNFREKDCVRDAYKLLNEFADELYGCNTVKDTEKMEKNDSVDDAHQSDEDDDISTALNKEINELKTEYAKPVTARRFQVVDTGVKNVIFIKSTLENPLELVNKIVCTLDETKQQRTRFLLRLLPIEVVCKAYMIDIKLRAEAMLEKYFAQEPKTFSIVFNRHSNKNIHRDAIIEDLAEIISKKNPGNKADLKNPELAVIVEVIRGVCLMCVAPNYYKFKKYNLLEICNVKENGNSGREDQRRIQSDSKEEENLSGGEDQRSIQSDSKEEENLSGGEETITKNDPESLKQADLQAS